MRVPCKACTGEIRYAETAAEAVEILERRQNDSYQRLKEADDLYADFEARVCQTEASLMAPAAPKLPPAPPPPPVKPAATADKVVPFTSATKPQFVEN